MRWVLPLAMVSLAATASAHDIWVEVVPAADSIRLALMLGNHGNHHRDFKLASQVSTEDKRLEVVGPDGGRRDLTALLRDNPLGYWSAATKVSKPGMYIAVSTMDKVMSYAPVRDVKSAKAFFAVGGRADRGFDRVLGHPLELVPLSTPLAKAGDALRVRVLFKGKPLPNAKVSFIPRGVTLKGEIDPTFEKMTNTHGEASIALTHGDTLVVTHLKDETAKGNGYESIGYGATLFVTARR